MLHVAGGAHFSRIHRGKRRARAAQDCACDGQGARSRDGAARERAGRQVWPRGCTATRCGLPAVFPTSEADRALGAAGSARSRRSAACWGG